MADGSKVAEYVAQKFYPAVSAGRDIIGSFYVPPSLDGGIQVPQISFNGNTYPDGESFQRMITEIEALNFDIESLDCAPLSLAYTPNAESGSSIMKGKHMTVLVTGKWVFNESVQA